MLIFFFFLHFLYLVTRTSYNMYVRYFNIIFPGMASSCYVYVAEISTPSTRGFLSAIGPVFVSFGVLIVYSLGYIINWKAIAFVCAAVAVLTFAATLFVPESPSWLATNGSLKEATVALQWFRRDRASTEAELADILETVKISRNSKPRTTKEMLLLCRRSSVWKPLTILMVFFALQELSGIYVVLYYAVDFFHNVGVFFNDYVASIMVGTLRFLVSIVGAVCIQFFNRKIMATWSGVIMAATMAVAAFYEHMYATMQFEYRPMAWIPLVGILLNVSASMLGMLQLPWLMVGELFPLAIRGIMGGIVTSFAYLFIFVTVKFYPLLMNNLKVDGSMWLFCAASIAAAVFAAFYLPETKDKTLYEIERAFLQSQNGDSKDNLRNSIITQSIPTISLDIERQMA